MTAGETRTWRRSGPAISSTSTYSKYLTIWIRDASGAWRWLLDGGNSRPAPAP
jgi:hypothetical protein